MKRTELFTILCCAVVLFAAGMEAQAASARARCEVDPDKPRIKVKVDGQDLGPGMYKATVLNMGHSENGVLSSTANQMVITPPDKQAEATENFPDVDLDFDSTADPDDKDSYIDPGFAVPNDYIEASVIKVVVNDDDSVTETTVAMGSARCKE